MITRLHEKYRKEAIPALSKRFGFKNTMAVPRVSKVTVNIGLGEASANVKLLDTAVAELGQIAGQKPVITRAKNLIANFKIRKGMPIGDAESSVWTAFLARVLPDEEVRGFLQRLVGVGSTW